MTLHSAEFSGDVYAQIVVGRRQLGGKVSEWAADGATELGFEGGLNGADRLGDRV